MGKHFPPRISRSRPALPRWWKRMLAGSQPMGTTRMAKFELRQAANGNMIDQPRPYTPACLGVSRRAASTRNQQRSSLPHRELAATATGMKQTATTCAGKYDPRLACPRWSSVILFLAHAQQQLQWRRHARRSEGTDITRMFPACLSERKLKV